MAQEQVKTAKPSMTERFRAFLAPVEGTPHPELAATATTLRRVGTVPNR